MVTTTEINLTHSPGQLGSAAGILEFSDQALVSCRVYATFNEFVKDHRPSGDILCLFANNIEFVVDLISGAGQTCYVAGPGVNKGRFIAFTGLERAALVPGTFDAISKNPPTKRPAMIVIDHCRPSRRYARQILSWCGEMVGEGGPVLVRRYAYWLKGQQPNRMVAAIHEMVGMEGWSVSALILNGNGWPDIVISPANPRMPVQAKDALNKG